MIESDLKKRLRPIFYSWDDFIDDISSGKSNLNGQLYNIAENMSKNGEGIMKKLMDDYKSENKKHFEERLDRLEDISTESKIFLENVSHTYNDKEYKISELETMDKDNLNILFLRMLIASFENSEYKKFIETIRYNQIFNNSDIRCLVPFYLTFDELYEKNMIIDVMKNLSSI